jgi:rubrerythrin
VSLKGTKTEKNLWLAFAGESQARNKYLSYAERAAEEGYEEIGKIFVSTANDEDEHAKEILKHLGAVNNTLGNLKLSAQCEHYEAETLYKEFERVALAEGLNEIADFFNLLSNKESIHQKQFLEAAKILIDSD